MHVHSCAANQEQACLFTQHNLNFHPWLAVPVRSAKQKLSRLIELKFCLWLQLPKDSVPVQVQSRNSDVNMENDGFLSQRLDADGGKCS